MYQYFLSPEIKLTNKVLPVIKNDIEIIAVKLLLSVIK